MAKEILAFQLCRCVEDFADPFAKVKALKPWRQRTAPACLTSIGIIVAAAVAAHTPPLVLPNERIKLVSPDFETGIKDGF